MDKIIIVFADSGLELIPREIWGHPAVRSSAIRRGKNPSEIILDVSLHYHAMKHLPDAEKRGRPDILHISLLVALSSLLNKRGYVELFIHTYRGDIIRVDSSVRLPRNYNRFIGLMEQLLLEGKVPPKSEKPLLEIIGKGFNTLVLEKKPSRIILFDEKGLRISPREFSKLAVSEKNPMIIIGCFQRGNFSREIINAATDIISLADETLDTWVIVARIISSLEDELKIW